MKFELKIRNHNVPDEQLLSDLKNTAARLGRNKITIEEYRRHGVYNPTTLSRRFGNWNNTLQKAGLAISKPHNVPDDLLFDNLKRLWLQCGSQPSHSDMYSSRSDYSDKPYIRRFGSWEKALETFVAHMNALETEEDTHESHHPTVTRHSHHHQTARTANWRLRFFVLRRDNFKCAACGRTPATDPAIVLHVDHIHPWDKGGETVLENLQTLCSVCNIGKADSYELQY